MADKIVNWVIGFLGISSGAMFAKYVVIFAISLMPILELRGGLIAASLLDVPALPANASTANVRGLHYSVEGQTWEVLTPVSVNGTTVEFALIDCSPIAVYVTDAATSPATGVASNWTLFMGAAVVLFAVSAIASKKTR